MFSRDTNPFVFVLLLILGIESIVAFLANGFIMAVNGYRRFQSRKVLPSDLLLTTLGISRFLLQLVSMILQLLYFCTSPYLCNNYFWMSISYTWTYFSSASIWCATWLSVYYCVKITNFAHSHFLWLKTRIDVLVPRLLGMTLTVFSLPYVVRCIEIKNYCTTTGNKTGNTSQGEGSNYYRVGIYSSAYLIFIAINVSICLTASTLLLTSLWRHTRNLKRSGVATKDFNTQAHINVVKSVLSFLFLYILYAVVVTVSFSYSLRRGGVEDLVTNVLLSLSTSAHSIILILTNPKLKDVFIGILKIKKRNS